MWRMLLHRSAGSLAILAPLLKDLAAATTSILSDHAGSWMLDIYIIHTFYILNCWKFTGLVQKLMTSYNLTLRGGALTWPQLNVQVGSSVSTCFNMFQHVSTCFNMFQHLFRAFRAFRVLNRNDQNDQNEPLNHLEEFSWKDSRP